MESLEKYVEGIEKSDELTTIHMNPICEEFADDNVMLNIYKNITILYSNSAQACINTNQWLRALKMGGIARQNIELVKDLCIILDKDFDEEFGTLEKKIKYRINMAKKETFSVIRLVSYSDQPVDGVGVGTIIKATDVLTGDMFCSSHVLITEYERGGVRNYDHLF